jgi:hypothetical protein
MNFKKEVRFFLSTTFKTYPTNGARCTDDGEWWKFGRNKMRVEGRTFFYILFTPILQNLTSYWKKWSQKIFVFFKSILTNTASSKIAHNHQNGVIAQTSC